MIRAGQSPRDELAALLGGSLIGRPPRRDGRVMNPRALAATVAGTIAATVILLVFGTGMFLVACVFAALVWMAVVTEQRDDARRAAKTARSDRKAKLLAINRQLSLQAENLALKAEAERLEIECDALHQENMRLHLELTEAQVWAGGGPQLRLVQPSDSWLEQIIDEQMMRPNGDVS